MMVTSRRFAAVALHILTVVVGGYFLTTAWVALVAVILVVPLNFARSEAMLLAGMGGIPVYAIAIIWAWSRPSLGWLWLLLGIAILTCLSAMSQETGRESRVKSACHDCSLILSALGPSSGR